MLPWENEYLEGNNLTVPVSYSSNRYLFVILLNFVEAVESRGIRYDFTQCLFTHVY